jgi:Raf kinase inhibitor-like YbhB/YbcL family protein
MWFDMLGRIPLAQSFLLRNPITKLVVLLVVFGIWLPGELATSAQAGGNMALQISSSAFSEGQMIPKKFTCGGEDVSPELIWKAAPTATQSFALIVDDPDAPVGTWVHWVLYDLPANVKSLPEGVEKQEQVSSGALQGRNDFRKIGYGGPCPPPGKPHRYYFKLYALDTKLGLKAGASKKDVEHAMQGHILAQAQLMGRYGR